MPTEPHDELVREAVEALFHIAWEDDPPEVAAAMSEQIADLPLQTCRSILDGLVDTELLVELLEHGEGLRRAAPARETFSRAQLRLVDAALIPLAELLVNADTAERVRSWPAGERARVLFTAVNRSSEPTDVLWGASSVDPRTELSPKTL